MEQQNKSLNMLDSLDIGIHHNVKELLTPLYESSLGDFFSHTIFNVTIAQYLSATLVFILFMIFRTLFSNIVVAFLQKLASFTKTNYDNKIISALKAPMSFTFIIVGLHMFFLIIYKETELIKNILNTLIVYNIFWAILALTEALRELLHTFSSKLSKDLHREIENFMLTIIKIIIMGIGLGAMLQVWGIDVTALIASLGIGGLAFALAAKDTASNLFASFSLLADKSIAIGEWIKVKDVEGTVEHIGMRTTKIRSFGKALITVPNQVIANNPIENFSRRGIRRIKLNIGLTYNTTSEQVSNIVTQIKDMLKNHDGISVEDTMLVNFSSFGDSSLNIFVYTFTNTSNWKKYMDIREDVHKQIMQIVEDNNSGFAFPSQSLYVEQMPS